MLCFEKREIVPTESQTKKCWVIAGIFSYRITKLVNRLQQSILRLAFLDSMQTICFAKLHKSSLSDSLFPTNIIHAIRHVVQENFILCNHLYEFILRLLSCLLFPSQYSQVIWLIDMLRFFLNLKWLKNFLVFLLIVYQFVIKHILIYVSNDAALDSHN